jgi:ParB family transcriptional regulator, chromosome partitioning protein
MSTEIEKSKGLGRGLASLIPGLSDSKSSEAFENKRQILEVAIDQIKANREQPRGVFEDETLKELAQSIKENGIIQPVLVKKNDSGYELIAGERRWRAAQLAGLSKVPVIIQEATPRHSLELALIENVQRENLNCIEESKAYARLIDEYDYTQEDVARRVGKDRSTVANSLRLLKLPQDVKDDLVNGKLTMGHARALLGIENRDLQLELRNHILKNQLSVRDTEALAQKFLGPRKILKVRRIQPHLESVTEELCRQFGTKVRIHQRANKKGKVVIEFYSDEDLTRIIDILKGVESNVQSTPTA